MNEIRSYNHNLKAQLILLRFILLCAAIREMQNRLAVLSLITLSINASGAGGGLSESILKRLGDAAGSGDDGPINETKPLTCDGGGSSGSSASTGSAGAAPVTGTGNYDGFYPPGVAAEEDADPADEDDDEQLLVDVPAIYYVGVLEGQACVCAFRRSVMGSDRAK